MKIEGGATNKGTKTVKGGTTTIEADDFYFEKTFQKVTAGQTVSVTIENEGSAQHTFTIDSLNIDEVLERGRLDDHRRGQSPPTARPSSSTAGSTVTPAR